MRLIDATTLKAEFTGNFRELWHYTGIWAVIDNAPTIEPKKGTWVQNKKNLVGYENGEKKFKSFTLPVCGNCQRETIFKYNFCPHCGADMRGAE